MAIVTVVVQKLSTNGLDLTDNGSLSISDTYQVPNNGKVFVHFKKTGAGACTVTIVTPGTLDGNAVADKTFSVPATTGDIHVGPFEPGIYNASGQPYFEFTLSEVTGLTYACARLG
jgi:hypothetical protein